MSEREARAVAAGESIEVNGTTYRLRPISFQHLCDLERDALRYYKRQYLETFRDNADLLGDDAHTVLTQEMAKAAKWDLEDLPQRAVHDVRGMKITEKLKKWIEDKYGEVPKEEQAIRALVSMALDSEALKVQDVKEMTGVTPTKGMVRYDNWWVTGSMDGMSSFILTSLREDHPQMTRADVVKWPLSAIAEAVKIVGDITTVSLGNG
jgi:uncharacterized ubiquitin-like protein YukD